ncbi:MAG: TolC family protein [Verrucomicrobiaceae bacterium]|nr:TolC family protein [Verrucomicrobiaceae bacterium]
MPENAAWQHKSTAKPVMPTAATPAEGNGASVTSTTPADSGHEVPDTLRGFLAQALDKNLHIKIARNDAWSAKQGEQIAKADFDPVLGATGLTSSSGEGAGGTGVVSQKLGLGTELRAEAGTVFLDNNDRTQGSTTKSTDFALRVRQPLLRGSGWGVNHAPIEKARILASSADATTQAEILETLRGVESAYWTASFAKALRDVQSRGVERARRSLELATKKRDAGAGTKIDVLEAESSLAAVDDLLVQATRRHDDAVSQLLYLTGRAPSEQPVLNLESLNKAATNDSPNAADSYRTAMASSPVMLLLANSVRAGELDVKMAKNRALPRLDAEFNYGSAGLFSGVGSSSSSTNGGRSDEWAALLRVSIPWTMRAERAQLQAARFDLERNKLAQADGMKVLEKDIYETCRAIASAQREHEAASRGVAANTAKYDELRQRYDAGLVTMHDLTMAEDELRASEARRLETRLRHILSTVLLARQEGSLLDRHALTL